MTSGSKPAPPPDVNAVLRQLADSQTRIAEILGEISRDRTDRRFDPQADVDERLVAGPVQFTRLLTGLARKGAPGLMVINRLVADELVLAEALPDDPALPAGQHPTWTLTASTTTGRRLWSVPAQGGDRRIPLNDVNPDDVAYLDAVNGPHRLLATR